MARLTLRVTFRFGGPDLAARPARHDLVTDEMLQDVNFTTLIVRWSQEIGEVAHAAMVLVQPLKQRALISQAQDRAHMIQCVGTPMLKFNCDCPAPSESETDVAREGQNDKYSRIVLEVLTYTEH